ncbi:hypothetical protein KR084_004423, partial [Drosophila pseudotakahashii]
HIELTPQLNIKEDIDSYADALESVLVAAAKVSTPQGRDGSTHQHKTNLEIEQLVLEKRRLRRAWQTCRSPSSKQSLKEAGRRLTRALRHEEVEAQRQYIEKLSPTSTKHPLWKAHPNLSAPSETVIPIRDSSGSWARSDKDRACTFALHLRNVFQPNPATNSFALPSPPLRIETETDPIQFQTNEVAKVISEQLKPKKAPGGDLITAKMLIELPNCAVEVICKLFNGITRLGYFPKK